MHSLFLKRLARSFSFSYVPPKVGHEGLVSLIKQAYNVYQTEVVQNKKSYNLCMFDLINSSKFHDNSDAWSKNEHYRNFLTITKLLMDNKELVISYFSKTTLNDSNIEELINSFYAADSPLGSINNHFNFPEISDFSDFDDFISYRNELAIELIVVVANENKLFKEHLDASDAKAFLGYEKLRTLTATNNSRLVLFLDKLSSMKLIKDTWQMDLSQSKLIKSSSEKKILTQHDLSSSLYNLKERKAKKQETDLLNLIEHRYLQLKDKKSTKGNF